VGCLVAGVAGTCAVRAEGEAWLGGADGNTVGGVAVAPDVPAVPARGDAVRSVDPMVVAICGRP
jgi:hypothetical protein